MLGLLKLLAIAAVLQLGAAQILDLDLENLYNPWFFSRPGWIVRQHHGKCSTTDDGKRQDGSCISRPECSISGGRPQGRGDCRLGVCCVYSRGCSQESSKRVSYFEYTGSLQNLDTCQYTVQVENNQICQMRLDFESLDLPPPSREELPAATPPGVIRTGPYLCRDAYFQIISPNSDRIPILCGNNNGQHIYVPVNASSGERNLVMRIVGNSRLINNNNENYSWKIKVTQLECPGISKTQKSYRVWEDADLIAPAGCLQYYRESSGEIRNLGYDRNLPLAQNHYQANLDYAICFRKRPDMCGINFNSMQFSTPGVAGGTTQCTVIDANTNRPRDLDFLYVINGRYTAVDANGVTTVILQDRYCGLIPIDTTILSSTPGPLYVFFRTDNQVTNVDGTPLPPPGATDIENGFQLRYTIVRGRNCQ